MKEKIEKRYELLKEGSAWRLYFYDNEFSEWVFVRPYKRTDTIKKIYVDIKNTYKGTKNYNIIVKFNLNN